MLEKLTLKEARNTEGFVNQDTPNKSMDVRAKQRLCYKRRSSNSKVRGGGFAPRHLSRYAFLVNMDDSYISTDNKTKDLPDWAEVLAAVCKRPGMYVASPTLENVLDFIGGYLYAEASLSPEIPINLCLENKPEWRQFCSWLGTKFGYPRNFAWYYARKYFTTDEEAIEALPILLEEFRKEKENP